MSVMPELLEKMPLLAEGMVVYDGSEKECCDRRAVMVDSDVEAGIVDGRTKSRLGRFIDNSTPFTWYIIGWGTCFILSSSGLSLQLQYPLSIYATYLLIRLFQVIAKERQYPYGNRGWREKFDSGFVRWAAGLIHFRTRLEQLALEEEEDGGEAWLGDAWRGVM